MSLRTVLLGLGCSAAAGAVDVPASVRSLYDNIVSKGECSNSLQGGFLSAEDGDASYCYCADHSEDYGIMYLQGTGGKLGNMDIDCDGLADGPGNDGRCDSSDDTQYQTAFKDIVSKYNNGVEDLNSYVHDFVVFGNYGSGDYINFHPEDHNIHPLSVMAVVCGDQLVYGVWGDSNGDDGPPLIGEASLSLATRCFGNDMNGNYGYSGTDVLYIAFDGEEAVPGEQVDWRAQSSDAFQESLRAFGDKLIQSRFG